MSHKEPVDEKRRSLVFGIVAATLLGKFNYAGAASTTVNAIKDVSVPRKKYALVIGNRDYPNHKDLPPAHKNVTDIVETLKYLEFNVTSYPDLHAEEMSGVLTKFNQDMQEVAKNSQPDSMVVVFYFCGHGFQTEGENYLVPAGIDPSSESAAKKSFKLMDDIVNKLHPYKLHPEGSGITIALIDACRTDPMVRRGKDDFNQIIVPDGTIVFFATRAGRPALAPIDENRNTFFTGSLVAALRTADGVTPVDDLFQIVANNCLNQVSQELKKAGLNFPPQFPEKFSGKFRNKYVIRNRQIEIKNREKEKKTQESSVSDQNSAALIKERWAVIQQTIRPRTLIQLCEEFKRDFPDSEYAPSLEVAMEGARKAMDAYRAAKLSVDSLEDSAGNADYHGELVNALRGDKDATYRIAVMYRDGINGLKQNTHRAELWLGFAAELGNGIASWQLSEIYSSNGQQAEQAKYEKLAIELGYTPPPRLANRGY